MVRARHPYTAAGPGLLRRFAACVSPRSAYSRSRPRPAVTTRSYGCSRRVYPRPLAGTDAWIAPMTRRRSCRSSTGACRYPQRDVGPGLTPSRMSARSFWPDAASAGWKPALQGWSRTMAVAPASWLHPMPVPTRFASCRPLAVPRTGAAARYVLSRAGYVAPASSRPLGVTRSKPHDAGSDPAGHLWRHVRPPASTSPPTKLEV